MINDLLRPPVQGQQQPEPTAISEEQPSQRLETDVVYRAKKSKKQKKTRVLTIDEKP
jgi:hypothetical protein